MPICALSSYSFHRLIKAGVLSLEQTPGRAAALGAEGIEFALGGSLSPPLDASMARSLRAAAEDAGLPIVGVCVAADLLNGGPAARQRALERVGHEMELAAEMGSPRFRFDLAMDFEMDCEMPGEGPGAAPGAAGPPLRRTDDGAFEAAFEICVETCQTLANLARTLGIFCSLENHGRFIQHHTRLERLVNATKQGVFGITLDLGNVLFAAQDARTAVQRLAKSAFLVHMKDFYRTQMRDAAEGNLAYSGVYARDSGDYTHKYAWETYPGGPRVVACLPGDGDLPLGAMVGDLLAAGYDGPWVYEFEVQDIEVEAGIAEGLRRMRALVASTVAESASSGHQEAENRG